MNIYCLFGKYIIKRVASTNIFRQSSMFYLITSVKTFFPNMRIYDFPEGLKVF